MRKPDFCICENKGSDQLHGNHAAGQHFCFCYINSMFPLLSKSESSSLLTSFLVVQPGLSLTWPETPETGFLVMQLKYESRQSTCQIRQFC